MDVALVLAALACLLAAGLLLIFGLTLKRSLDAVTATARRISAGDTAARVPGRLGGITAELTQAFNQMAESVQEEMASGAQERGRLAAALNSSIDAVVAVDRESRVLFANVAAERLFQRPAARIVNSPFVWIMPNEAVLNSVRASRDAGEHQAQLIERAGRQYLQVVTTPIIDGGDWAVLVVFHDLTDVRRTELMRRDFVANVSHELRTPLAAIKSVVETIAGGAIDEPKVAREFLARADAEVDRLILLVEELLELSRIESGDVPLAIAPVEIEALLMDVVERMRPQAERKQLSLMLETEPDLGELAIDAGRIEHAVINLVHNAIKFTAEGGSIVVSARRADDRLFVRVKDSGIGIAADELPRVFERFYKSDQSRASQGSGIGLAIVKHAVEAHGGSVSVESELGRGSTFSLSIPAAT
jgi:two-component system phosphate regulon sensor histidine kinase PhoR